LLGAELLVIGIRNSWRPWSWFLLLTLPLAVWFLRFDRRNAQSVAAVLLDELARDRGMTKIQDGSQDQQP